MKMVLCRKMRSQKHLKAGVIAGTMKGDVRNRETMKAEANRSVVDRAVRHRHVKVETVLIGVDLVMAMPVRKARMKDVANANTITRMGRLETGITSTLTAVMITTTVNEDTIAMKEAETKLVQDQREITPAPKRSLYASIQTMMARSQKQNLKNRLLVICKAVVVGQDNAMHRSVVVRAAIKPNIMDMAAHPVAAHHGHEAVLKVVDLAIHLGREVLGDGMGIMDHPLQEAIKVVDSAVHLGLEALGEGMGITAHHLWHAVVVVVLGEAVLLGLNAVDLGTSEKANQAHEDILAHIRIMLMTGMIAEPTAMGVSKGVQVVIRMPATVTIITDTADQSVVVATKNAEGITIDENRIAQSGVLRRPNLDSIIG